MSDDYSESYAQVLEETIILRRYTGTGTSRPHHDVPARGRAVPYAGAELVAEIRQGDQRVIVLVADLIKNGMTLPVTTADKAIVKGRELAIQFPQARKAPDGTLIAYELQCRS